MTKICEFLRDYGMNYYVFFYFHQNEKESKKRKLPVSDLEKEMDSEDDGEG